MKVTKLLTLFLGLSLLLVWGCDRKVTEQVTKVSPSSAEYIGSEACQACHADIYASFRKTGHPYKLNEAKDVQNPDYYPFTTVPNPPPGVSWSDVSMVIGGFWWKARFIDTLGYIITGDSVQYNPATGGWVAYHSGETVPYDCGPCHMTGYKDTGHQNGKEGLIGTWALNGIQCEECHGPGSVHQQDPYNVDMVVDRSNGLCAKCHIRGESNKIPASGGFIRHHEQWNEMSRTKHAALKCVDCHDPHIGLHPSNPDRAAAIKLKCENCHIKETESFKNSGINHYGSSAGPDCIDCHMPKADKSATASGPYEGDLRSHLCRINIDPNAEMFTSDGHYANGYLTLEYTCLTCHSDKDKTWAANNAVRIHSSGITDVNDCFTCHTDHDFGDEVRAIEVQWAASVHATGGNFERNTAPCSKCHTNEGFKAFLASGDPGNPTNPSPIGCFTCHAPHTNSNFSLRTEAPVALEQGGTFDMGAGNLCANCHQARTPNPPIVGDSITITSAYWGPHHGPQASTLSGNGAYVFTGATYGNAAHTSVITEGCPTCHMADPYGAQAGGHTFNMTYDYHGSETDLTKGCTQCHGTLADFNYHNVQDSVQTLLDSLRSSLINAGILNSSDLANVPYGGSLTITSDSAGALYNYLMFFADRSNGVHNADYVMDALNASINIMATGSPLASPKKLTMTTHK